MDDPTPPVSDDSELTQLDYEQISQWSDEQLLAEFESLVEFRAVESARGQVSKGEMQRLERVRAELRQRLGSE